MEIWKFKCILALSFLFLGQQSLATNNQVYSGVSGTTSWELHAAGIVEGQGSLELIRIVTTAIESGQYKSISIASKTFNSPKINKAICTSLQTEGGLELAHIYIDSKGEMGSLLKEVEDCSENVSISILGKEETEKITPTLNLNMILLLNKKVNEQSMMISMSGALNEKTMKLSFENWLVLRDSFSSTTIQKPLCAITSLSKEDSRYYFAKNFGECSKKNKDLKGSEIWFKATPRTSCSNNQKGNKKECVKSRSLNSLLKAVLTNASVHIKANFNHFSQPQRVLQLLEKLSSRVDVSLINNDDLLRVRKGVIESTLLSETDVKALTYLDAFGANQFFLDQSSHPRPFNGRWMQVDNRYILKSSADLADNGLGVQTELSIEHFYIIKAENIIKAYDHLWAALRQQSSVESQSELGKLPEASKIKDEVRSVKDLMTFLGLLGHSL